MLGEFPLCDAFKGECFGEPVFQSKVWETRVWGRPEVHVRVEEAAQAHLAGPQLRLPAAEVREALLRPGAAPGGRRAGDLRLFRRVGTIGVLVGCFARKIDGPGLLGGLIVYQSTRAIYCPKKDTYGWNGFARSPS